jgi:hypothetical protein
MEKARHLQPLADDGGVELDLREDFRVSLLSTGIWNASCLQASYPNIPELYWHLKDRIKTVSIPWQHRDKFQELASLKYKFSSNGKIQIESKAEIKARIGKSPDYADALSLTFSEETEKPRAMGVFWLPAMQENVFDQSLIATKTRRY